MSKQTEIITIGDEVLMGQIVNTNASDVADRLTNEGISVCWMTTIGDDRQQILDAFLRAKARAGAVIVTGGLGPTPDDITQSCIAEFFEDEIVFREDLLEKVEKRFKAMGLKLPPQSRNQANFPAFAKEIPNPIGTATGIHYNRGKNEWFSLPGVPAEMRQMMDEYVIPRLRETGFGDGVSVRIYRTAGIGESFILGKMKKFDEASRQVEIAFLPRYFGVDVKLTCRGDNSDEIEIRLDKAEKMLLPDIKKYLFARGNESLPEVVGKMAAAKGLRIAVAESCTGGLIAKLFTDTPGSSDYFDGGVVAYSNKLKTKLLGVPADLIEKHGAVSEPVAEAMAVGLLKRTEADIAVSVTGIAGPGGGTDDKPVGLIYIGVADKNGSEVKEFRFKGNREMNRNRSAFTAIRLVHDRIKNLDLR